MATQIDPAPRDSLQYEPMLDTVRNWVDGAARVVVLTGAGISTDSGIPDFRGPQGVWTKNPGAEKLATLQNYLADPDVRRRAWRVRLETAALMPQPNAGHRALVALERRGKLDTLITQNVDGLHLIAGSSPERVIEIHGTTREVNCMSCGERAPMERALARVRAGEEDHGPEGGPPLLIENIVASLDCQERGDEQLRVGVLGKGGKVAPAQGSRLADRFVAARITWGGVVQVGVVRGEHLNPASPAGHRLQDIGRRGGFAVAAHQKQCPAPGLVGDLAKFLVQDARLPGAGSA